MEGSKVQAFYDSLDEPTSSDVIRAIFAELSDITSKITRDIIDIQEAFYALSKEHGDLLGDFRFNVSGIHPRSEELERVIYRLECSHALGTLNPSYSYYQIDKNKLNRSLNKFSAGQQDEIKEISKKLSERIKVCVC